MLLKDFFKRFPDEKACVSYFLNLRLASGAPCPKCGGVETFWLQGRNVFQCQDCGYRFSLTRGTVMERSHLPLYYCFFTAHMMTGIKQVLSAKEIQHQLEMRQYSPVWLMMMKYRDIMGKRDAEYKLAGNVELDVSFFPTTSVLTEQSDGAVLKTKKTKVLVVAESKFADDILRDFLLNYTGSNDFKKTSAWVKRMARYKVDKNVRYIKMFAIPNRQAGTMRPIVARYVAPTAKAVTDGGNNLVWLRDFVSEHVPYPETEGSPHEVVTKILPWVHIVTRECRSGIEAIHKEVDERFLQLYLNEYCWKFNRRFFRDCKDTKYDLFDLLLKTAAKYTSDIKWRDYEEAFKAVNIH